MRIFKLGRFLLFSILFLLFSFTNIEIDQSVHFRNSSFFAGTLNLVGSGVLKPGTKAEVLALDTNKKLGVGVQVKIKSGANKGKVGWVYFPKEKSKRTFHFFRVVSGQEQKIDVKNFFNSKKLEKLVEKERKGNLDLLNAGGVRVDRETRYYRDSSGKDEFWKGLAEGTYQINSELLKNAPSGMIPIIVPNCDQGKGNCTVWLRPQINDLVQNLNLTSQKTGVVENPFAECYDLKSQQSKDNSEKRPVSELSLSQKGIDFLKQKEGFKNMPYEDGKRNKNGYILGYSIGYGHYFAASALPNFKNGITMEVAEELLKRDIKKFENVIKRHVKVPLTQSQFDALVSLVYNIGSGNFTKSTVLKKINKKALSTEVEKWWTAWKKATVDGIRGDYLLPRRKEEWQIFSKGF